MTVEDMAVIIENSDYNWYGVRKCQPDEDYNVNDFCRNSYDWTAEEETELNGTCAVMLEGYDASDDAVEIEKELVKALKMLDKYSDGKIVLVAGDRAEYGNDDDEIVIEDAKVLAV